ncbi:MAG: DUF1385 domain-containing protein [Chloroflexota bacterium]|nr:MAG: DUF1385 domain-containing protein [SAR202 cluster bacterium]MEC7734141.1 DUF1385 domain-containing protein [Chloroflexota bacterium]MED5410015.1 DUF1385 domain-containing protein [Chloroflexota bacterium]MED5450713.1 DUF1385 domain-containing protein [Chloroflexota bacterium]MEE3346277.1 DUF1385 domain-containing protein [Chloroflexota bacterium]
MISERVRCISPFFFGVGQSTPRYGGQAVIEGIMIRGQNNVAIAVRAPSGNIVTRVKKINTLFTGKLRSIPIIRGVIALAETLSLGMEALNYSSQVANDEEDTPPGKFSSAIMILISLSIAIGLFFILPLVVSKPFEGLLGSDVVSNVAEGIIRLAVFLIYVTVISLMPDIRRVYMYHGAEHMAVHAQEKGDPLTIQEIRKYPTAHPRCGTAFLLTIMVIAIIVFTLIPREPLWLVVGSRIVLIPLIASLSYEFIRFNSKYETNKFVSKMSVPSLLLQSLTTKIPDDDQIEVAINAMESAIDADRDLE